MAQMTEHWLNKIVPASRVEASGLTVMTWVIFGNDDSGIFGQRDNWSYLPGNGEHTFWTALRWWIRNPFHNLTWHVLARDTSNALVLAERPAQPGKTPPYRRPHDRNWLAEGSQYQSLREPFFISWRGNGWQTYIGLRENGGRLGMAFKRHRPS